MFLVPRDSQAVHCNGCVGGEGGGRGRGPGLKRMGRIGLGFKGIWTSRTTLDLMLLLVSMRILGMPDLFSPRFVLLVFLPASYVFLVARMLSFFNPFLCPMFLCPSSPNLRTPVSRPLPPILYPPPPTFRPLPPAPPLFPAAYHLSRVLRHLSPIRHCLSSVPCRPSPMLCPPFSVPRPLFPCPLPPCPLSPVPYPPRTLYFIPYSLSLVTSPPSPVPRLPYPVPCPLFLLFPPIPVPYRRRHGLKDVTMIRTRRSFETRVWATRRSIVSASSMR